MTTSTETTIHLGLWTNCATFPLGPGPGKVPEEPCEEDDAL